MNPFKQKRKILSALKELSLNEETYVCPSCEAKTTKEELSQNYYICPSCNKYYGLTAKYRIKSVVDNKSFKELCGALKGGNPLDFPNYSEKLEQQRESTGLREAVIVGTAKVGGIKTVICAMDSRFMMASMGMAVGEKITRAFEYATKKKLPIIIFCTSGGARMQEGILSLFQMAKTSAAAAKHSEAGLLYISVMTNPTTGGVTASFASLGDIILAEPGSLIGFAGPRVIEQTIGQSLPDGFQSAEYLMEHGFIDMIVPRQQMRETLITLLKLHIRRKQ